MYIVAKSLVLSWLRALPTTIQGLEAEESLKIFIVCEDCNSTNLERDTHTGELTCIDCGLVIETLKHDDGNNCIKKFEEIAQNFRPTTKTNKELERKLKRYELFNKPKRKFDEQDD